MSYPPPMKLDDNFNHSYNNQQINSLNSDAEGTNSKSINLYHSHI